MILQLFLRFMGAYARSVWWKLRGWEILASKQAMKEREGTCRYCPYLNEGACDICKCPIISKIVLSSEQCPRKYWLREKVAVTK